MRSVLFVCTANICRSPVAEGVLRSMLVAKGIDAAKVRIDSAGTSDYRVGQPPFPAAVESAAKRGYKIGQRAARQVSARDFDEFDLILAMDRSNIDELMSVCPPRLRPKIELLMDYGDAHRGEDVPDPFGRRAAHFERALELIEEGCRGLARSLTR